MVACLGLAGCGGPSVSIRKSVNSMVAAGNYEGAAAQLERVKQSEYGKSNAVLYHLDVGAVLHYAGRYKESDEHFDLAEKRMEELYTVSATKALGTLLLNDTTQDYSGEVFERALTNVFRAMNYVFMGMPDEALVEARKVEVFLDEINRHRGGKNVYKDDAFARYLDSLLYEDAGKWDDARISRAAADKAYEWYASKYGTRAPDFSIPEGAQATTGEVIFIHYNGVAPRKISKTIQIAWKDGLAAIQSSKADSDDAATKQQVKNALAAGVVGSVVTVAFPEYVQDPFAVVGSELCEGDTVAPTVIMEDISAIAMKDLHDRMLTIRTRAIARATTKLLLAKMAEQEMKKRGGNEWAAKLAGAIMAGTEVADTRGWTTVPAQIRMARVRLAPGTHTLTARFKDASGAVVSTRVFNDVVVKKGRRTYIHQRTAL